MVLVMNGYAKLASDEAAKQKVEAKAVQDRLVRHCEVREFFKSLEIRLGKERNAANDELLKADLLKGERAEGITIAPETEEEQIKLRFGERSCDIELDVERSQIRARFVFQPIDWSRADLSSVVFEEQSLIAQISEAAGGQTALLVRMGGDSPGCEWCATPQEIAKEVVSLLIRGRVE